MRMLDASLEEARAQRRIDISNMRVTPSAPFLFPSSHRPELRRLSCRCKRRSFCGKQFQGGTMASRFPWRFRVLGAALLLMSACGDSVPARSGDPSGAGEPTGSRDSPLCSNTCKFSGDNVCDDGRAGSVTSACSPGTDCGDCGPRLPAVAARAGDQCLDTCLYVHDNTCDDGGPGSVTRDCAWGTDCGDCGPRNRSTLICNESCASARNGRCDDGGVGAFTSTCALGSDCADCGAR